MQQSFPSRFSPLKKARGGRHETCKLEIYDGPKRFAHLIKVSDDLIEEPETLNTHVVPVQLDVEVVEVGDGGEQHSDLSVGLIVQVLEGREVKSIPG